MADYVSIQNENLEPGAPWISATAFALRDNLAAAMEGAPGAPRISGQQGPVVNTGGLFNGAVTNAKVSNGTLGAEKFQTGATERNWVLARTAAAAVGAVGTYAMLFNDSGDTMNPGDTRAGSDLRYSNASGRITTSGVSGTWRCMGRVASSGASDETRVSVFLRIS